MLARTLRSGSVEKLMGVLAMQIGRLEYVCRRHRRRTNQ
jgi:hypothetical protein